MRRILFSVLLASAAASPAIAAPHNWSDQSTQEDRQSAREERQSAREDRQQAREERQSARQERSAPVERAQPNRYGGNYSAPANAQAVGRADQRDVEAIRSARQQARQDRSNFQGRPLGNVVTDAPGPRVVDMRDRRDQRAQERELRQQSREAPRVIRNGRPPVVSDMPRPGTQPPLRNDYRNHGNVQWNTNWRHDGRHDWHGYRNHHRSLFHLGFYYDPYGWGYQPFSIGWRLWPSYYSQNYWINDPWMYRLPYAPQGYVWVRYWNDALLVDTWSGTVVDVIPGFFW